jgi:hypothetical protein
MEDVYSFINMSSMDWFIELLTARKLSHPLCCSPISENIVSRLSEQLQEGLSSLFKDADDDKISKDDPSYTFVVAYAPKYFHGSKQSPHVVINNLSL